MTTPDRLTTRRRRVLEALQENERLTHDLTDDQARVLLDWAGKLAEEVAGNAEYSDALVDQSLRILQRTIRRAALNAAAEHEPTALRAAANEALEQELNKPPSQPSEPSEPSKPSEPSEPTA